MITYPVTAGGVTTRVLQGGLTGSVVLLLHGLGARADRWTHNLDILGAAGVRALAVDLPGHGFAQKGEAFDYSAAGYSDWLEQFIQKLGARQVVLIGTSFGGLVAARYAADHPHRVTGLMLVGAIGLVPIGTERREVTVQWLSQMGREQIRARMQRGVLNTSLITEELVEEDWRINNSDGAAKAFDRLAAYYRDQIDNDVVAWRLSALGARFPIKIAWGESDLSVSPKYGEEAHQIISGSQFEFLSGCRHFPYWERAATFNESALRFLTECNAL